jgi:hypothetical protein
LVLPVVAPDLSEGADDNSLFVWTRRPEWRAERRISFGALDGPAHHPTYRGGDPAILTWYSEVGGRRHLRFVDSPGGTAVIEPVALDSAYADLMAVAPHKVRDGALAWIAQHDGSSGRQIRVVVRTGPGLLEAHDFDSPFATSLRSEGEGSEIAIIGGMRDPASGGLTTGILYARIDCP